MDRNQKTPRTFAPMTLAIAAGLVIPSLFMFAGCSGNTDGGDAANKDPDSQFVATDGTVGTILLGVEASEVAVGETTGYFVIVKDSFGNGVPNVQIACDTEQGLALVEPTTGLEHTNANGAMSAKLGCEAPGSFQIACRLPIGGNKRMFKSVRCTGSVPEGFAGFPGAGGGGLGGGVSTPDEGGTSGNVDGVRLTAIKFYDRGTFGASDSTSSIDVKRETCDSEPEPFFDTHIGVTIDNSSVSSVTVKSINYFVPNANGSTDYQSGELNITGEATLAADNGASEFIVPVFRVNSVDVTKEFSDASGGSNQVTILETLGLRNVTVQVTLEDGNGDSFTLEGTAVASFSNFNSCS